MRLFGFVIPEVNHLLHEWTVRRGFFLRKRLWTAKV